MLMKRVEEGVRGGDGGECMGGGGGDWDGEDMGEANCDVGVKGGWGDWFRLGGGYGGWWGYWRDYVGI